VVVEKLSFFESAILNFYFQKKKNTKDGMKF
jgi:hypothetical protein